MSSHASHLKYSPRAYPAKTLKLPGFANVGRLLDIVYAIVLMHILQTDGLGTIGRSIVGDNHFKVGKALG